MSRSASSLTGAWGKDAPAAAERLAAAIHVVSESPFGRLIGLDHPVVSPQVRGTDEALVVDVTIDGAALARGVHDALDAEIGDIMRGGHDAHRAGHAGSRGKP